MKIVFMGTPEFSVPILEELNKIYDVCLVVTQPDSYVGRRKQLTYSPVKVKALQSDIEVFQPLSIKKDYQRIIDMNADVLITAAYGQIIPKVVLDQFSHCINVHGSLLPLYRGGAPIQRSIINGDSKTGITIMKMVKKMDAGCIYAQKEIDILDTDSNHTLFDKLSILGKDLLISSLEDIVNNKNLGVEQNEELVTYAPNIKREEELIDFNKSSLDIFNQIRGLSTNPGSYFSVQDYNIKVFSSKIVEDNSNNIPGTILSLKKKILIKTLDNAIELGLILPQGKKLMNASDFVNGQKVFSVGDIVK